MFRIGQLVALRSDPDTCCRSSAWSRAAPRPATGCFATDARPLTTRASCGPWTPPAIRRISAPASCAPFSPACICFSPSTANLYSLRSGRVQFVPYQYRPVLRLIRADRPRLLIADEVGVGKTIEAGLIVKELRARTDISSVLVICPKALVTERKWFVEMKRFDERFEGARWQDAASLPARNPSGRGVAGPLRQGDHTLLPVRFGPSPGPGRGSFAGRRGAARPRSAAEVRPGDRR